MDDSAATNGTEATAGSLDSQQTTKYSLPTLDNVNKTPSEASRTRDNTTDKAQEEQLDTADLQNQRETEQGQGICTDSNEKDGNVEDGNGEMDKVANSDSPKQVSKTEDSDQTEKGNRNGTHQTNEERKKDSSESVDKEKTAACGLVNEEVNSEPPNAQHNKPVVQESPEESMELKENKGVKVNKDEDTGQTSSASKEHTSRLVQEENSDSDSSDDDHRPWASKDTQMYRLGYPVSQVKPNHIFVND